MRMMVKKLLKRYKYPPEGMDDAVQTVLAQCELWTDSFETESPLAKIVGYDTVTQPLSKVAAPQAEYGEKEE